MGIDLSGSAVITAGMFSARVRDHGALMDELDARIIELGGRVVGRHVQRRGISGGKKWKSQPGGRASMQQPYSARMVFSHGKVRELAVLREALDAVAVVFFNEVTPRQRAVLCAVVGCPVLDQRDL